MQNYLDMARKMVEARAEEAKAALAKCPNLESLYYDMIKRGFAAEAKSLQSFVFSFFMAYPNASEFEALQEIQKSLKQA